MKVTVAVVTHKEYRMPDDPLYIHLMAGSALRDCATEGYVRDDTGDNISASNRDYCELTGLYWMWKNSDAGYIGICHYRRYFSSVKGSENGKRIGKIPGRIITYLTGGSPGAAILDEQGAEELLRKTDVILPARRRYVIETNYSHYAHAHDALHLDVTREIIRDRHPSYIPAYDRRMGMRSGHRFNMFIMRKDLADRYCEWLFDILAELERRLKAGGGEDAEGRVPGYVGERLLDVWLDANMIQYTEIPYVMTEKEHIPAKAARMMMRRLKAAASGSGRISKHAG